MSTSRLEAFCDGVFAIAATLLIVDVHADGLPLSHGLLHAWPSYAAYAVSFVTIGIMWANHHTVFTQVKRVDRTFLMLNVFLMMAIAFVPFPTALVASQIRGEGLEAAAMAYGATLTITALFYNAMWFYAATGRRLLSPEADPSVVSGISRSYVPGPFIYCGATLAALGSPPASVSLYAAIALFYVFESSLFARGRRRQPAELDASGSPEGP
jgi:uncharacterized membrane protein